jgi:predicted nuclease of predicted toxin-antitoxin system
LPFIHVSELNRGISDKEIWEYAKVNALVIVTKDADFSNRMMLNTPPPWVVHLRFGNVRRVEFHDFLARVWPGNEELLPGNRVVNVYLDRIEAIRYGWATLGRPLARCHHHDGCDSRAALIKPNFS